MSDIFPIFVLAIKKTIIMKITIIDGAIREAQKAAAMSLMEKRLNKQANALRTQNSTNTTLPDKDCIVSIKNGEIEVIRNRYGENTSHGLLNNIISAYLNNESVEIEKLIP